MKAVCFCTLIVGLFVAPGADAGNAKIITIADQASPEYGRMEVAEYLGPLPAAASSAGRDDIPQMPGFPTTMGGDPIYGFNPTRGFVLADLTGDGYLEIVASSTDKKIWAWDYQGNLVPGFPVSTIERAQYAPSVADMDGDGDMEIVQFTRGLTSGGRVYVVDHEGNVLPGFPVSLNNNNISSCPTLYDLDDDGMMEFIVPERDYPIGLLHIFELDGTEWGSDKGSWPVELDHVPACTAAVGDADNDGEVEICYLSYDSIYLIALDGDIEAGWPKQLPNANFSYQSPAMADLDGDGDLEIVVGAHKDAAGCYVLHHDGGYYHGWPQFVGTWTYCPPTVTDLEGDGVLEILDGRAGYGPDVPSDCFWAWDSDGNVKTGFPYHQATGGGSEGPIIAADIDGDGLVEVFADYNIMSDDQGYLFGVDSNGNDLPGFPIRTRGFTYMNGATIGDVDNDGDYELGVLSTLEYEVTVNLYDLPYQYASSGRDWLVYHGRNSRGGLYPTADACPADVNNDDEVNIDDLFQVLGAWGPCSDCPEDIDDSGVVDIDDVFAVLADWGPC